MHVEQLLEPGSLSVLFQPIVDFSGEEPAMCAVEALTRGPAGGPFERADVLFDYVRLKREEIRFDHLCIANALVAAQSIPDLAVHVNLHAATLERDPTFAATLQRLAFAADFDPSRLVIELVEQSPYFDSSRFLEAVRRLRCLGAKIAMDDVGLGNCNYRMLVDARPDCLKIDRYFVAGCVTDRHRHAVIRSVLQIAHDIGATLIAEGIEREDELRALRSLGVRFGQGFLFGRPAATPRLDVHNAIPHNDALLLVEADR